MKVLIAPLNWGLGHAGRCIPLVIRYLRSGDEVVLAGDGDSLLLLRKHFPGLRYYNLAPLDLRYSSGKRQVGAMMRALPKLLRWARKDHQRLSDILAEEHFDILISDNRFGCYSSKVKSVYITHQLHIFLPHPWKGLEKKVEQWHCRIAHRFDECWVPDYAGMPNLSGGLSHDVLLAWNDIVQYIGPLSRMTDYRTIAADRRYEVVIILSGLEPQRTLLERHLLSEWAHRPEQVLLVRGQISAPPTVMHKKNITVVPYLGDEALAAVLLGANTIIARSGYSTIMDLDALKVLSKATLIPTPGQPEQEYLATLRRDEQENHKMTIR